MKNIIILLLLLLFLMVLLMPWKRTFEPFVQPGSSIDLYQRSDNHNDFIAQYDIKRKEGMLQDSDRLLHMRGCYQIEHFDDNPTGNILNNLINLSNDQQKKVERVGPIYTNTFSDVESKIALNIRDVSNQLRAKTRNPNAMIEGEIFVLIMQAPFYKSSDGSMMSVQFNIQDYAYMPVNVASAASVEEALNTPLDFEVFVIYSNYKKNMTLRSTPYAIDVSLMPYRTKHEQCNIICTKKQDLICGCTSGNAPRQHYMSKCVTSRLGATTIEQRNQAISHDFPILYVINRQSELVLNMVSQVHPRP